MDRIKLKDDISFRNRLIRPRYNKHFIFIHHVERVKCCFELFFIFLDYERKKSVGSAFLKKIVRVGRVTGNTELFFGLILSPDSLPPFASCIETTFVLGQGQKKFCVSRNPTDPKRFFSKMPTRHFFSFIIKKNKK